MFFCISEQERNSIIAFHEPFVFLVTLLAFLVGLHFQALNISPVDERHFAITLLLIIAAVVYGIAYASRNLQTHNAQYLPIFRLIYLASGILTCELLVAMLVAPFWWFMVNLCTIPFVVILRGPWHQPIYQYLCRATNLVHDWLQQKFLSVRSAASQASSLTNGTVVQENGGTQVEDIV